MDELTSEDWPPMPRRARPQVDQAYIDKINKEMIELAPRIQQAATQPFDEKDIWATVGDIRYGHPVTPLLLRYRALMWQAMNPPDPRGEKMYSRPGPYTIYVRRSDLVDLTEFGSASSVDRLLAHVRGSLDIKPYGKITVEQFCFVHGLREDDLQQKLHQLFLERWKKFKRKNE
jgi:hypothetical protein